MVLQESHKLDELVVKRLAKTRAPRGLHDLLGAQHQRPTAHRWILEIIEMRAQLIRRNAFPLPRIKPDPMTRTTALQVERARTRLDDTRSNQNAVSIRAKPCAHIGRRARG